MVLPASEMGYLLRVASGLAPKIEYDMDKMLQRGQGRDLSPREKEQFLRNNPSLGNWFLDVINFFANWSNLSANTPSSWVFMSDMRLLFEDIQNDRVRADPGNRFRPFSLWQCWRQGYTMRYGSQFLRGQSYSFMLEIETYISRNNSVPYYDVFIQRAKDALKQVITQGSLFLVQDTMGSVRMYSSNALETGGFSARQVIVKKSETRSSETTHGFGADLTISMSPSLSLSYNYSYTSGSAVTLDTQMGSWYLVDTSADVDIDFGNGLSLLALLMYINRLMPEQARVLKGKNSGAFETTFPAGTERGIVMQRMPRVVEMFCNAEWDSFIYMNNQEYWNADRFVPVNRGKYATWDGTKFKIEEGGDECPNGIIRFTYPFSIISGSRYTTRSDVTRALSLSVG